MKRFLPWAGYAAAAVLALLLVRQWSLHPSPAPDRERAELRDAGLVVAEPVEDLRPALEQLTRQNAQLRDELARVRRAAPSARPVAVTSARTEPTPASGAPTATAAPCLVAEGDRLEVRVDQVELQTAAGSRVVAGTAAVLRADQLLLRAPWSARLTSVAEVPPERPRGWGAGPWALADPGGWAAGVVVAAPPVRLLGLQLEVAAGAGLGSGRWAATAQLVVRP